MRSEGKAEGVGVRKRIKSWVPKLKERVGKVGVWKRLDLALLERTRGVKGEEGAGGSEGGRQRRWRGESIGGRRDGWIRGSVG